jgi:periplasmic protein TonB
MSDLVNLSNCVMDGNPGGNGWARRLRRKAFVGSLALQAVVVGAMLLWPLISPAVLPMQAAVTPVPPYYGQRPPTPVVTASATRRSTLATIDITVQLHPTIGRRNPATSGQLGEEPPIIGDTSPGGPGISIPGGSGDGRPIRVQSPAGPKRPLSVSAGVMAALLVHRVQPAYPALAIVMHLSGTVELQARIGTDGTVQELEVESGNPILARAAIEAVQQWRYQPTRLDGQPVEVETHITVTFTMEQ